MSLSVARTNSLLLSNSSYSNKSVKYSNILMSIASLEG